TAGRKLDGPTTLEKRDRGLNLGHELFEPRPSRGGGARECDQCGHGERHCERGVDPPRARRTANAGTPSNRTVAVARDRVPTPRAHADASDQRPQPFHVSKLRPETI